MSILDSEHKIKKSNMNKNKEISEEPGKIQQYITAIIGMYFNIYHF